MRILGVDAGAVFVVLAAAACACLCIGLGVVFGAAVALFCASGMLGASALAVAALAWRASRRKSP